MNIFAIAVFLLSNLSLSQAQCNLRGTDAGLKLDIVHVASGSWDRAGINSKAAERSTTVKEVSFNNPSKNQFLILQKVQGQIVNVNDLGLRYWGYFYAKMEGEYTFYLDNVDDGAWLYVGDDAFSCCGNASTGGNVGNPALDVRNNTPNAIGSGNVTVSLSKGYHQFKVLYYNYRVRNSLTVAYSGPKQAKTSKLPVFQYAEKKGLFSFKTGKGFCAPHGASNSTSTPEHQNHGAGRPHGRY